MHISIEVRRFFDWEHDDKLSDEQFGKLARARQAVTFADGRRAKRVQRVVAEVDEIDGDTTTTTIAIPQSQLDEFRDAEESVGETYEQLVANHVQHVMRHHAEVRDWVRVSVPEDPELEAFLDALFIAPRKRRERAEKRKGGGK